MSTKIEINPQSDRELVICRLINAPRANVYQAWTKPELLKQWFTPKPWKTPHAELDVRAGGTLTIHMQSPDGETIPYTGVYLEVIPNQKLIYTDAYTKAWDHSEKASMTFQITFEEQEGKTKYTARILHWSAEDRKQHEEMGFHDGWAKMADQLEELAANL